MTLGLYNCLVTLGLYNPQETVEVFNGKYISRGGTWSTSHITKGKNQFAHVKVFTEKCSWNRCLWNWDYKLWEIPVMEFVSNLVSVTII